MIRAKWWRLRSKQLVADALLPHLGIHESKQATEAIFDALEEAGFRIVRDHKRPAPAPKVVGTGMFRIPGEARAWRDAEDRARGMMDSLNRDKGDR